MKNPTSEQDPARERAWLIDAVVLEMERVWGSDGLQGEVAEYGWLLTHYEISEEDDNKWLNILQFALEGREDFVEDDNENAEILTFLEEDGAVVRFLLDILKRYRSCEAVYRRS